MGYNTTGLCHRVGIANEKMLTKALNYYFQKGKNPLKLRELFPNRNLLFKHQGGTQQVADMSIHDADTDEKLAGVSIKHHKTGTYDHINTTKIDTFVPGDMHQYMKDGIKAIKEEFAAQEERVEVARAAVDSLFLSLWERWDSAAIRALLQVIHGRTPALLLINTNNQKLSCYKESAFLELAQYPYNDKMSYFLRAARAKTSRQIWRRDDLGNEVCTHLRLRMVLNNGVTALLGLSSSNKTSVPTIKVQQDNVDALLEQTQPYSIEGMQIVQRIQIG